jgi:hypothetical protein
MTDLLDTIDKSLQEVEEQLLDEFSRIRNALSDAPFAPIDIGIRNALGGVVTELYGQLDQSGDRVNLQMMSEVHEVLLARIVVLRRLIDSKVPTAYLHEAHTEVSANRRQLEAKVVSRRSREEDSEDAPEKGAGLFGKIKGLFSGESKTEKEVSRNRIRVNVYLDNGIYSASRELAALANVFNLPEPQKQAIQAEHKKRMDGKAQFGSRDVSAQALGTKPDRDIAQSPDAIRRKLAERQSGQVGKASFAATDIEHAQLIQVKSREPTAAELASGRRAALEAALSKRPITGKASFAATEIEHIQANQVRANQVQAPEPTPAELAKKRRAVQDAEKAQTPTTGKASFTSRDIEPITPYEMPRRPDDSTEKTQDERPKSGKAIFESKDLSSPPNKG